MVNIKKFLLLVVLIIAFTVGTYAFVPPTTACPHNDRVCAVLKKSINECLNDANIMLLISDRYFKAYNGQTKGMCIADR